MKTIPLSQGKIALVDDEDYEELSQWKWCARKTRYPCLVYALRNVRLDNKTAHRQIRMHRFLLGLRPGDGRECDHIDGNGLNNQRSNLRICSVMQNQQNGRKRSPGSSKHKGVDWSRCAHKWRSRIVVNKKSIHLGMFHSEADAARAYDEAARKHFGDFALTNQMLGLSEREGPRK